MSSYQTITYNFLYGEKYTYDVYTVRDLESARPSAGIYAWFFRLPEGADDDDTRVQAYSNLFRNRRMSVRASGPLQEIYEGSIERVRGAEQSGATYLGRIASTVFCPPLYIGISVNLRARLGEHYEALFQAMYQGSTYGNANEEPVPQDTARESAFFGERMATALQHSGLNSISDLFVKVVYAPNLEYSAIQATEYLLNRTFFPLFGRK